MREDDLRVRPGRIRQGRKPESFMAEVMRAAKKAGHIGNSFGRPTRGGGSRGRGRQAARLLSRYSTSRRVMTKARIVRHHGTRFRSAPLPRHLSYLKREGTTRDGAEARMFDASSDTADDRAFAARTTDDRHHFRFIVSPEDADELGDLKGYARKVMAAVEQDLGTKLDWVAVDHWNTDNPHIHFLVRGRADDGKDLVISRDYISHGMRNRAAEIATQKLGPRTEQQIRSALEKEVSADRWTSLDQTLHNLSNYGGVVDLRPGGGDNPEQRRLLLGRADKLERLGLAERVGTAQWYVKPRLEPTLRALGIRGDIIRTMHQAIAETGREPDVGGFALHGDRPEVPIKGRLVARGLHDELQGTAYAVIDGIDGRAHHVRFADLELTGDARPGAIVELRAYDDASGRNRISLTTRSDLPIDTQVTARGATWLDRQLLAKESMVAQSGFGAEVRDAMERRLDHLAEEGLVRRQGQRVLFARGLLDTLQRRELDETVSRLSKETGLPYRPSAEGEYVAGTYRGRVSLASGRFAMIDDGLGFQLVPWRPALERKLGLDVSGTMLPGGGVEWRFGRERGLEL
jgi:type IV secretory pathway VirD2 relaxase